MQCANCQQSWQATAEVPAAKKPRPKPKLVEKEAEPEQTESEDDADQLFNSEDEAALDKAFNEEEGKVAETTKKPKKKSEKKSDKSKNNDEADEELSTEDGLDPTLQNKRHKAMLRRQEEMQRKLPLGRIRRNARYLAVVLIAAILASGFYFRVEIVRAVPSLAGMYESVGLGVNVVGLEFRDVQTLRALRDGKDVMVISARIHNVAKRQVNVPSVTVSILNADGRPLLDWSVTPLARAIAPGEVTDFETELNSAPIEADIVKLTFADSRAN